MRLTLTPQKDATLPGVGQLTDYLSYAYIIAMDKAL